MCGFQKGNNPLVLQNISWGLRCLGTKNTPSKIHFQWSMKGHNTAMKIEVAQTTLHFFIAIMLNSPSKKKQIS